MRKYKGYAFAIAFIIILVVLGAWVKHTGDKAKVPLASPSPVIHYTPEKKPCEFPIEAEDYAACTDGGDDKGA